MRPGFAVATADDEQLIERGRVYVCPTDHHMLVENGLIRLETSPREKGFRPSIDVLFRSALSTYGRRVIGVLLSGSHSSDTPSSRGCRAPRSRASRRTTS